MYGRGGLIPSEFRADFLSNENCLDYISLKPWILLELSLMPVLYAAVVAPPWADPMLNPCAREPRGWQLLFWPPDERCYKIFKVGYPCPDGMELSPATSRTGKELYAECRCPPKQALYVNDRKCYPLFTLGPCSAGHYFGPDSQYRNNITTSNQQLGKCKEIPDCPSSNSIFWMKNGKCYQKLTRGPCSRGQLLTIDQNQLPVCLCGKQKEMQPFRAQDGRCYQHFTKGPCKESEDLFLPDKTCGCHSLLPHYYQGTKKCYELGTIGPCSKGEMFSVLPKTSSGGCVCKTGNIRYQNTTSCHRPFTQGPCEHGFILVNATHCIPQPCKRGELYYPSKSACYRIGSHGPCAIGKIISFDFETRPSIDGVSYNGVCMCEKKNCNKEDAEVECDKSKGLIKFGKRCFKLYTQGPCQKGAWLTPQRQGRELLTEEDLMGVCECIPGNVKTVKVVEQKRTIDCLSPTYLLADYLNKNTTSAEVVKM